MLRSGGHCDNIWVVSPNTFLLFESSSSPSYLHLCYQVGGPYTTSHGVMASWIFRGSRMCQLWRKSGSPCVCVHVYVCVCRHSNCLAQCSVYTYSFPVPSYSHVRSFLRWAALLKSEREVHCYITLHSRYQPKRPRRESTYPVSASTHTYNFVLTSLLFQLQAKETWSWTNFWNKLVEYVSGDFCTHCICMFHLILS